ncbi:hypothetical protein OAB57_03570 [Bacteriovoracaceae bacterium]|nr:hypothetical protein [Bacteriovoracaceae bacterium]
MKKYICLLAVLLSNIAVAGSIRTIRMDSKKMKNIYLKLGQSTILRFKDTPQKVVVGNQNYFNIEFIGNDITIQPQAQLRTNLFVYSEHRTYGLILNSVNGARYDDLVNINWKSRPRILKKRSLIKRKLKGVISLDKKIHCYLKSIVEIKRGLFVIDFTIINNSRKIVRSETLDLFLTRSRVKISKQRLIFSNEVIESGLGMGGRIFFKNRVKKGVRIHLQFGKKRKSFVIPKRYLS